MFSILCLAAFVCAVSSTIIDSVRSPHNRWIELKRSDPNSAIKLTFMVKRENLNELERLLMLVSDPDSNEYGRFIPIRKLQKIVAPKKRSIEKIKQWLVKEIPSIHYNDIQNETSNSDILSLMTTIKNAETLLNTQYFDYQSKWDKNVMVTRIKMGSSYHVPYDIANLLDFVSPTLRFPIESSLKHEIYAQNKAPLAAVTPETLHELYQSGDTVGSAANNSVGIASFVRQYYTPSDLTSFWSKYNIATTTVTNVPSDTPNGFGLEAELDTQYMSSMAQKIPMQVWYTSGTSSMTGFENSLVEWSTNILQASNPPLLNSVSYGQTEKNFGSAFINKFNGDLMMMGTAGLTVLFASGDSGAGGDCTGDEPFDPDYPASSPYITAVGGVTGGTAGKQPLGESVWTQGGGGFSNFAVTQSWQTSAVSGYLSNTNNLPDSNKYNASGRGYPDIAAQSVDFLIEVDGKSEGVSGTSCASPTAGGIFGLLNDLRKQNNMSQLGFLNPFIYSTFAKDPTSFNDCTTGYNRGCSTGVSRGFPAATGWDAASGVGSPNYKVLSQYVIQTGLKTIGRNRS